MKYKLSILLTFLSMTASAQITVSMVGTDSVLVEGPPVAGALDYQISVQNADALWESTYYWSDSGTGVFPAPFCNMRVTRTSFDSMLVTSSTNSVEFKKSPISVDVSAMPGRKARVEVTGADFSLKLQHFSYGNGSYLYYVGSSQYNPIGNFQEGTVTAFAPYRIPGWTVATVEGNSGGCQFKVGKLFYLN